ncbi:NKAP family protein [Patella vulgata]|uniref:NKAP family protein n=1 Tax=Patella vulgata TaxID=6465 RepID=UPI00217FBAA4|nr:NKAP family protein [Patella vulgata]
MACSIASTSSSATLEDCICPICMNILIHPVTMPCQHELCMPCFKQNVEESSLLCPMCRTRIGTWARLSTKQNKLVNEKRWQEIQKLFPEKVKRRLEGVESEEDEDDVLETFHHPIVHIAEPGEIRKEYEEQLQKLQKQREVEQSKEEAESAALIRKLQLEEEERQRELERQAEEQRLKDEELARQLSQAAAETSLNEGLENNLPLQPESRSSRASSTTSSTSNGINTLDSFLSSASSVRDTAGSSFLEHNHETRYKEDKERNNNDHSVRTVNGFISTGSPRTKHGNTSWVESHHEQSGLSNSSIADTSNFLEQHREFVRNQFNVMSRYSDSNNKHKPATVTSNSNVINHTVVRSDCDSTTDNDDSLSCDPTESRHIDSESATSLVSDNSKKAVNIVERNSVPKRVVGLFPPEENTALSVDDIVNTNNNRNILSDDDDGDDEVDGQTSDNINTNNNSSTPSKKAKKLRKKSVKVPSPMLSPQRSIKDWFSPSTKTKKDNVTKPSKAKNTELTPKKRSGSVKERARTTAKKVVKKNRTRSTTVSQSTRKKLISSPQKRSRKSSRSLALSDEDYQSDYGDSEKSLQKTKSVVETDLVVPSPPKRQKRQNSNLSKEKNEEVFVNRVDKAMDVSDVEGGTTPLKESRKKDKKYDSVITPTKTSKSKRTISVRSKFDHSTESDENSAINMKEESNSKKNLKSTKSAKHSINKTMSDSEIDEDLKLALALQHQFDLEDKLARQVDRSKGSESEYLFRQKPSTSSPTKRA